MANGITGLSPFPTMGGGNQGAPGITPVQIQPTRVSFPTARTRAPTPETNELSAGEKYLPGILSIAGLIDNAVSKNKYKVTPESFAKEQERISKLKKQGLISDEVAEAELKAFAIYGPDRDTSGVDGMTIAGTVGTLFSGRMSPTSASITNQFANRKNTVNQSINTSKNQFKKESLKKDFKQTNLLNYEKLDVDKKPEIVMGITAENDFGTDYYVPTSAFSPNDPIFRSQKPVNLGGKEYFANPDGWVNYSASMAESLKADSAYNFHGKDDNPVKVLRKLTDEMEVQDAATVKLINLSSNVLTEIDNQIKSGASGSTTVATLGNLFNDVRVNFDQFFSSEYTDKLFSKGKDGGLGNATRGSGVAGEELFKNLKTLDQSSPDFAENLQTMIGNFIKRADIDKSQKTFLTNNLQQLARSKAVLASGFLNIAYYAAATAGQTGRTLSDKDLANFFRIIGGAGTQDIEVQHDVLLKFINSVVEARDDETAGRFKLNKLRPLGEGENIRYGIYGNLNEKSKVTDTILNMLKDYYLFQPDEETGITDYNNPYALKDFYTRNADSPTIQGWRQSNRQFKLDPTANQPDPTKDIPEETYNALQQQIMEAEGNK